jgi:phosphoribosylformylglycinamidine synthase
MKVTVHVTRRPEIADPQGKAVSRALADLEYGNVRQVRIDRTIHLDLDTDDHEEAQYQVDSMCNEVLVNPVLEDYHVEIHK